ncbi:hypothetical protein [Blastococcus sp. Marseille-P5729]|uniref:hypothetical protein n=1 Tax=Blastococcus sp. Marseille-P5729 TaxID=2086582 RepID=UPI001F28BA1A|nr:hypothetical protein [Blastococcus sp. Marseille-P5729]
MRMKYPHEQITLGSCEPTRVFADVEDVLTRRRTLEALTIPSLLVLAAQAIAGRRPAPSST